MRITVSGLILTTVTAWPVQAGIDRHYTNAGGAALTGGVAKSIVTG